MPRASKKPAQKRNGVSGHPGKAGPPEDGIPLASLFQCYLAGRPRCASQQFWRCPWTERARRLCSSNITIVLWCAEPPTTFGMPRTRRNAHAGTGDERSAFIRPRVRSGVRAMTQSGRPLPQPEPFPAPPTQPMPPDPAPSPGPIPMPPVRRGFGSGHFGLGHRMETSMEKFFTRIANSVARASGRPVTFIGCCSSSCCGRSAARYSITATRGS